jgi:polyhydroxybutyrate depolymerase
MKRRELVLGTGTLAGLSLGSVVLAHRAFAADSASTGLSPEWVSELLPKGHRMIELMVGAQTRRSLVYAPTNTHNNATPRKALSLVIMLHGMGGSAAGAMRETDWSVKAEAAGFIVAYPEATRPDETKPASLGKNPRAWNDGSGRFHFGEQKVDDVAFIDALIARLSADYSIDSKRIFVAGFSNGASMAFRVGAMLSHRVAAIAPNAGACWTSELQLSRELSVCYITGNNDSLNPLDGGFPKLARSTQEQGGQRKPRVQDTIDKWVKANRCQPMPMRDETRDGVHLREYAQEPHKSASRVQLITVDGLGHHWAGGKSQAPEWLVGKNSNKLNATHTVWEFFQTNARA